MTQAELSLAVQAKQYIEIFNDSLRIIDTTKNIDTLKSRLGIALANLEEIGIIESKGVMITEKPMGNTRVGFLEFANEKIALLAEEEGKVTLAKLAESKPGKSSEKIADKAKMKLIEMREAIHPEGSNADKYVSVINGILIEITASIKSSAG